MTNYFRKSKSLYSSTSNSFSTGESETITPTSVVGLPTDTELVLTFDRVDSSGTSTPTKMERILGTVTGGNFVVASGGRGYDGSTEQAHTSPVVEMIVNAADRNDLVDGILIEHNQTGTHKETALDSMIAGTEAQGDIIYHNGTIWTRLAKGTDGHVLKLASSVPSWAAESSANSDGWIAGTGTWTFSSADDPTFVIATSVNQTTLIGVGDRIKLTQTTAKYFIVTAIDASTITVYGGTDYDLAGAAIATPYFSHNKAPLGFPMSKTKWRVVTENTTQSQQDSPTDGTWYNLGTITIAVPIGSWRLGYDACVEIRKSSNTIARFMRTTLSTANNSESDVSFTSIISLGGASGNLQLGATSHKEDIIDLATKATYYLNHACVGSSTALYINAGSEVTAPSTRLFAECAYL